MAFMQEEITFGTWYEVDTTHGITFIPTDVVGTLEYNETEEDYTEEAKEELLQYLECWRTEQIYSISERKGYGARLSAPGYLDATEWSVFDTEDEAQAYLTETYGDDDEEQNEYSVSVGNIGEVYSGHDKDEAETTFNTYVEASKLDSGRAAGEDVTLFENNEPINEYIGSLSLSENAEEDAENEA